MTDKIVLYYFTGTGNTLHLVKRFKERLPGAIVEPIIPHLTTNGKVIPESNCIGLFYPNHAGHLPIPVRMFLERLELTGEEYLFAICNSAFSKSFSPHDINKVIQRSKCKLNAYINIEMPDNHTIGTRDYEPQSTIDFERCERGAEVQLNAFKEVVLRKESLIEQDTRPTPFPWFIDTFLRPLIFFLIEKYPSLVLKGALYADHTCNGCQVCERICSAYRIRVIDGVPLFDSNATCYGCYSCVNLCPQRAIQMGSQWYNGRSYSPVNGRYPHPFASASEIAKQKG